MKDSTRHIAVLLALSLFGIASHMAPHDMGVSTVGVVSMLAAAYLPRALMFIPALLTVFIVDAVVGFYGALAMSFVYLGHLAGVLAVRPILRSIGFQSVVFASIINAVVFYLLSNLTPMALGFYPASVEGWISCYVNALPFLLRGVMANLIFGGIAFGVIWLVKDYRAHRFAASQRH